MSSKASVPLVFSLSPSVLGTGSFPRPHAVTRQPWLQDSHPQLQGERARHLSPTWASPGPLAETRPCPRWLRPGLGGFTGRQRAEVGGHCLRRGWALGRLKTGVQSGAFPHCPLGVQGLPRERKSQWPFADRGTKEPSQAERWGRHSACARRKVPQCSKPSKRCEQGNPVPRPRCESEDRTGEMEQIWGFLLEEQTEPKSKQQLREPSPKTDGPRRSGQWIP